MRRMAAGAGLDSASWENLFDFLDPNRHQASGPDRNKNAEAKCVEIMRKLVCFFASRHCANAEDLATETVLRVAAKCRAVDVSSFTDRVGYFYAVARNVAHEAHRTSQLDANRAETLTRELPWLPTRDPRAWRHKEAAHQCLDLCIEKLTPRARRLILRYHGDEGATKIDAHRALAAELEKSVNALRVEVYRIRKTLQQCVGHCLQPESHDVAQRD
jgi:RNA polymerase sigma factor (sigma-70 family)